MFAARMEYCGPRGVPLLHFLGGPPGWTDLDRDAALAWHRYDRERCPSCGTHPSLWDESQGGDKHALDAVPVHCRGCEVKAGGDKRFADAGPTAYRRGTSVQLRPPERVTMEVAVGGDDPSHG